LGKHLVAIKEARDVFVAAHNTGSWYDGEEWHMPPRQFDWVICAGRIGPISAGFRCQGPAPNNPHPMHHRWIEDAIAAARSVDVPFCLPYLGEWAFAQDLQWSGDRLTHGSTWGMSDLVSRDDVDWTNVEYDDSDASHAPSYVQAVGSHLTGRALGGRVFDEWPKGWR
jgi:hypothetical protein